MMFVIAPGGFSVGCRSNLQCQRRHVVFQNLKANRVRRSRLCCARLSGDNDGSRSESPDQDQDRSQHDDQATLPNGEEDPLGIIDLESGDVILATTDDESSEQKTTSNGVCSTCNDEKSIPCTNCNAFGFLRIDAETVWRTCEICRGHGILICPTCQPPDALLPDPFDTDSP